MEIDISSNALNKKTQFKTRKTPQISVWEISFFSQSSVLCPPTSSHKPPRKKVAQIHLTKTSSIAGIPV